VPDPKSRTEGYRKLKTGNKEAHDTLPHLYVEKSRIKVTRLINSVTENQPYLRNVKTYELSIWIEYDVLHHRHAR